MKESDGTIVHGVVPTLSPMKKSKEDKNVKYFDSQLSVNKCLHVISFEPLLRQARNNSLTNKDPVCFVDCQVRGQHGVVVYKSL